MGDVIAFRRREQDRFGSCPECGRRSGVKNVGKAHWLYCDLHRTKWHGGFSLLSPVPGEADSGWLRNAEFLRAYREVSPLPWRWVNVAGAVSMTASES